MRHSHDIHPSIRDDDDDDEEEEGETEDWRS